MTRKDQGRYGNLRTRGGLLYYHYDALGSVSDLTDHLGENTVRYLWDAFGGMFAGTLAPYSFKGITGKDHDPKSGLMFYNSRWYDPQTGRFTHKRIDCNKKQKHKGPDWTPKGYRRQKITKRNSLPATLEFLQ